MFGEFPVTVLDFKESNLYQESFKFQKPIIDVYYTRIE